VVDPPLPPEAYVGILTERLPSMSAMSSYTTLAIFDFDDTLFRSPKPPEMSHEERAKWWRTPASLLPPYVPERPGAEWWNASVVRAARKAISSPETFAVVVTGRREGGPLRSRLESLLSMGGLSFDSVLLNPAQTGSAVTWKTNMTHELLSDMPKVELVQVWDDLADNVNAIEQAARSAGIEVEPHFVSLREELRYLSGRMRSELAR
jgi:hypothetical protein